MKYQLFQGISELGPEVVENYSKLVKEINNPKSDIEIVNQKLKNIINYLNKSTPPINNEFKWAVSLINAYRHLGKICSEYLNTNFSSNKDKLEQKAKESLRDFENLVNRFEISDIKGLEKKLYNEKKLTKIQKTITDICNSFKIKDPDKLFDYVKSLKEDVKELGEYKKVCTQYNVSDIHGLFKKLSLGQSSIKKLDALGEVFDENLNTNDINFEDLIIYASQLKSLKKILNGMGKEFSKVEVENFLEESAQDYEGLHDRLRYVEEQLSDAKINYKEAKDELKEAEDKLELLEKEVKRLEGIEEEVVEYRKKENDFLNIIR